VEAVLAVSAVVHSYRRNHPEADTLPAVLEIVYHLEQIARTECEKKSEEEEINSDKVLQYNYLKSFKIIYK